MRTKIAIKDLQIGMVIVDTGLSWIEHPYVYSEPGPVESLDQVQTLLDEGYAEAFIEASSDPEAQDQGLWSIEKQLDKAADLSKNAKTWKPYAQNPGPVPLQEELATARRIHEDSLQLARDCIKDVRMGRQVDYGASEALVGDVIESVMRNSNALVSLSKLRDYDEYTYTHSINVAVLTLGFAKHINFPRENLQELGLAALFHDLGKARIPDEILNKPGKLSSEEFGIIKKHPEKGVEVLQRSNAAGLQVLRGVGEHHEKFNGKGYPRGLAAEDICLFASIITLADVYDALTSKRVYKKGIQPNKAMSTIFSMRDQDFFPEHVLHFVRFLGIYPIGSMVRLSNGSYGLVISPNPGDPLRPNVKLVLDAQKSPCTLVDIDLSQAAEQELKIVDSFDPKEFGIDPARYLLPGVTSASVQKRTDAA